MNLDFCFLRKGEVSVGSDRVENISHPFYWNNILEKNILTKDQVQ